MGFARACSVALVGVEGVVVEVQADLEPGIAAFTLVGLPDKSLVESRDRVRAAVVFPVKLLCSEILPRASVWLGAVLCPLVSRRLCLRQGLGLTMSCVSLSILTFLFLAGGCVARVAVWDGEWPVTPALRGERDSSAHGKWPVATRTSRCNVG